VHVGPTVANRPVAEIPWNAAEPYKGLGFRSVEAVAEPVSKYDITEYLVKKA
jgi:hypothetical protein